MNMAIQNTCPATWGNSSIVPNQGPFQAIPMSAADERIARIRDEVEISDLLNPRIAKRLQTALLKVPVPTGSAFGVGSAVLGGLALWNAAVFVVNATIEESVRTTLAPIALLFCAIGVFSFSVIYIYRQNAAPLAAGAAGALPLVFPPLLIVPKGG